MNKLELRVVKISDGSSVCEGCAGKCVLSNEEYPHLVEHVVDDCASFVVAREYGRFWSVGEFFLQNDVSVFWVKPEEMGK